MNRAVVVFLTACLLSFSNCEDFYFSDNFTDESFKKWIVSTIDRDNLGKFEIASPKDPSEPNEKKLKTTQDAKFYRISTKFDQPFSNKDSDLCVQFTVAHEQSIDCGGGYLKLFGEVFDPEKLDGNTPYQIMFGPDICGYDKSLVHVIFSHKGENYLIKKEIPGKRDEHTHLYTLIVKPDNTFEVKIDEESVRKGSLSEDWDMLPPKKINDPSVSKPADWVDEEFIDDPTDVKPEDWDQLETIEDPNAKKPEDWDDEMDGDWTRPMIPNPEHKGDWVPKKITNPLYKGPWEHPQIPNPEFVGDAELYARTFSAVGFDLWQVKSGSLFGDLIISTNLMDCQSGAAAWRTRHEFEEKKAEETAASEKQTTSEPVGDNQETKDPTEGDEEKKHEEL